MRMIIVDLKIPIYFNHQPCLGLILSLDFVEDYGLK